MQIFGSTVQSHVFFLACLTDSWGSGGGGGGAEIISNVEGFNLGEGQVKNFLMKRS